ncbi:MAG TPA: nuclease A inhibitor family protein [Blastocatellia bacterium]|nr:nuclease A inhibitor family protein [Blastocatellia bacterium]
MPKKTRSNPRRTKSTSSRARAGKAAAEAASSRVGKLRHALQEAASGLTHQSDSYYPFRFFSLPSEGKEDLTAEGFLIRLGISQQAIDEFELPVTKLIEEQPLEDFLPTLEYLANTGGVDTSDPEEIADAKQFTRLEALLKKRLRDVKVFRVGFIEVRCYIAGFYGKDIAGLVTTSIET